MCVIIKREPNIVIPSEKIISACHVNPHGYGFSVLDRGKLETIKVQQPGGNEADQVLKLLEDAKDKDIYLHLRYTTAGKTNEANCHPFKAFAGDNFEVQFMHNGTLSKFSKGTDADHSDTWHFNEEFLKPLLLRFYEVDGAGVLTNPLLKQILDEFRGGSAFMLYDNEGNHLAVENTSCKQWEGWWSSNEYSFNRAHRDPPKTTSPYASGYNYDDYDSDRYGYGNYRNRSSYSPTTRSTSVVPFEEKATTSPPKETATDIATKGECKQVGYAVMQAKKQGVLPRKLTPPDERATFQEMAYLDDLKDIMVMTESDIYDLVAEMPLAATALIMDLIHELYVKEEKTKRDFVKNTAAAHLKGAA